MADPVVDTVTSLAATRGTARTHLLTGARGACGRVSSRTRQIGRGHASSVDCSGCQPAVKKLMGKPSRPVVKPLKTGDLRSIRRTHRNHGEPSCTACVWLATLDQVARDIEYMLECFYTWSEQDTFQVMGAMYLRYVDKGGDPSPSPPDSAGVHAGF